MFVRPDGKVRFLYSDDLLALLRLGESRVRRATYVEPVNGKAVSWRVDLSDFGEEPSSLFPTREKALAWESQWLEKNVLGASKY